MLLTDVHVNGVVAVRAANALLKRQIQHLLVLAQIPDIRLVARKTRAVDAALLAGADADGLTVLRIADGVRLRVFQRDEGEHQIKLCVLRNLFAFRHKICQHVRVDFQLVSALLERDAENILVLNRLRLVIRVDLNNIVRALTLCL